MSDQASCRPWVVVAPRLNEPSFGCAYLSARDIYLRFACPLMMPPRFYLFSFLLPFLLYCCASFWGSSFIPELHFSLYSEQRREQVELKNKDDWVKINAGQHTLMRVLYTPEMMKRLERGVRDRTLTPEVGCEVGPGLDRCKIC